MVEIDAIMNYKVIKIKRIVIAGRNKVSYEYKATVVRKLQL